MAEEEVEKICGEKGGRRRTVVGAGGGEVGGMVGDSGVVRFEVVMGGVVDGRIVVERGGSG